VLFLSIFIFSFFFFQAEDGIRDFHVTGVQTCALPISEVFGWTGSQVNMLKVRGAASSVRRDLEPYRTLPNFLVSQGWGGETVAMHNNNYPNENIRPEKVVSYEFGVDSRFFNNR